MRSKFVQFYLNLNLSTILPSDIDTNHKNITIKIYNRKDLASRLTGAILRIMRDGTEIKKWTIIGAEHEYIFEIHIDYECLMRLNWCELTVFCLSLSEEVWFDPDYSFAFSVDHSHPMIFDSIPHND